MANPTNPAETHYLNLGFREASFTASGAEVTVSLSDTDEFTTGVADARLRYSGLLADGYTKGRLASRAHRA